jgi:uncharacterized membrane protein (DUF485 family)
MNSSGRISLWSRFATWQVGSASMVAPRAFLQQRVAVYVKVLLLMALLLLLSDFALMAFADLWLDSSLMEQAAGWSVGYIGVVIVMTLVWRVCARGERPTVLLRTLEVGATLLISGLCCAAIWWSRDAISVDARAPIYLFGMLFICVLTMVVRAAVVPSSTLPTLAVGLAATLPAGGATYLTLDAAVAPAWAVEPTPVAAALVVWGIVFSIGTAVTSRVIYGLHARVREAMQLGQYSLGNKIGEGGMGAVYEARHALLRRPSAIKLLPPDKAGVKAIERFSREVQETARLTHPNIVSIYDFGHTPDGLFYYVMELLDGLSLEELIDTFGPQPPSRVVRILTQAAHGLAAAHGAGLIHRDIKPANILLVDHGDVADLVKIVDFGLVRDLTANSDVSESSARMIVGTPMYTAPEIVSRPEEVDARSDIYSLGAVGYFLITGKPVFEAKSAVEVFAMHLDVAPEPPSERLGRPVPEELASIIMGCLAKAPVNRPASAREMWRRLRSCPRDPPWGLDEATAWWQEHAEQIAALRRQKSGAGRNTERERPAVAVSLDGRRPRLAPEPSRRERS